MRIVTREQAIAYRLHVNNLVERLPSGSQEEAAYVGLQDTAPRDALLGLHARMAGCSPADWEHPALIQTYSPRAAVYVLPARDFGVFTLGRKPLDSRRIDVLAENVCRTLGGEERRGAGMSPADALVVWDQVAHELVEVDFDGVPGWVLRDDADRLWSADAPRGVRLLAAPDLRLFGRDRDGRFIAPGLRALTAAADSFHPNGLLVDGRIVGAWGRKGGRVDVVLSEGLSREQYDDLCAEVTSLPVRDPRLSVR
ncbi:DNA glycosylase AlkZ-like family protein [Kribbella sp. NPDC055110]